MTTYSVAAAKSGLPRLIDRALKGEEVIITRHGTPVVELRATAPAGVAPPGLAPASYAWLCSRRDERQSIDVTSVELLDQLYDEPAR